MSEITLVDKLACARRELRLRQQAYPGFVQRKAMMQAFAEFQIACMAAIVEDYEAALIQEVTTHQGSLFGPYEKQ